MARAKKNSTTTTPSQRLFSGVKGGEAASIVFGVANPRPLGPPELQIGNLIFYYGRAFHALQDVAGIGNKTAPRGEEPAEKGIASIEGSRPVSARDAALQLQAIAAAQKSSLSGVDLDRIVADLIHVTKSPKATKKIGALHRGGKLTRAGLLYRYQAFLMQELQTVGRNLYGNHDCASVYVPLDDAVNSRLRKSRYPFHDESTLPKRARSILKSLRIDTNRIDQRYLARPKPPRHSPAAMRTLVAGIDG